MKRTKKYFSRYLEALLVRQADGKLKNLKYLTRTFLEVLWMADMIEYAHQIDMFYSFLNGRLVNGGGWESGPRLG